MTADRTRAMYPRFDRWEAIYGLYNAFGTFDKRLHRAAGHRLSAADIAGPVLFLASPLARHITG